MNCPNWHSVHLQIEWIQIPFVAFSTFGRSDRRWRRICKFHAPVNYDVQFFHAWHRHDHHHHRQQQPRIYWGAGDECVMNSWNNGRRPHWNTEWGKKAVEKDQRETEIEREGERESGFYSLVWLEATFCFANTMSLGTLCFALFIYAYFISNEPFFPFLIRSDRALSSTIRAMLTVLRSTITGHGQAMSVIFYLYMLHTHASPFVWPVSSLRSNAFFSLSTNWEKINTKNVTILIWVKHKFRMHRFDFIQHTHTHTGAHVDPFILVRTRVELNSERRDIDCCRHKVDSTMSPTHIHWKPSILVVVSSRNTHGPPHASQWPSDAWTNRCIWTTPDM